MAEVFLNSNPKEASREPHIHIDIHLHLMIDPRRFAFFDPLAAVDRERVTPSTGSPVSRRAGGGRLIVFVLSAAVGVGGVALFRAAERPSPNLTEIYASDARGRVPTGDAGRVPLEAGAKAAVAVTPPPGALAAGAPAGPSVFGLN